MIFPSTTAFVWGLGTAGVVWYLELGLALKWNYRYFTTGIPIFVRRVESVAELSALSLDQLQRSATSSWLMFYDPVFRRLSSEVIAFRQMPFGVARRWPFVRGVIRREVGASSIAVTGYLNWYEIVGWIVVLVLMRQTLWFEVVVVVIFGLSCWLDVARFRRVATAVSAPVAHHDPQLSQL